MNHNDKAILNFVLSVSVIIEPPHEKTNSVVFEQVPHKPACTVTEDG